MLLSSLISEVAIAVSTGADHNYHSLSRLYKDYHIIAYSFQQVEALSVQADFQVHRP